MLQTIALLLVSFSALASEFPYMDPAEIGKKWMKGDGMCQFRGNPTHTYTGCGDIPEKLKVLWKRGPYASWSKDGAKNIFWQGSGWTGQPTVWAYHNFNIFNVLNFDPVKPKYEVVLGAYDKAIHFFDLFTGEDTRKHFMTGDLIKGSLSIDPDGYPLVYSGSRDNYFRILSAIPGEEAKELWKLSAHSVPARRWNDDWDANASIVNDFMIEGGENSYLYVVKLNRSWTKENGLSVKPEIQVQMSTYDAAIAAKIGKGEVSVENSPILFKSIMYAGNSSGRIMGLDLSKIDKAKKTAPIVFDYWVGDDTDASLVVDEEGMLYVSAEMDHNTQRGRDVGQLIKLDPTKSGEDAKIWSVKLTKSGKGGIWATPTLYDNYVYTSTHQGDLLVVHQDTGEVAYKERIGFHEWGSSVISNGKLIVPTVSPGGFRIYDVKENPAHPRLVNVYKLPSGGGIEGTPLVYNGMIVVGSWDGYIYAFGEDK